MEICSSMLFARFVIGHEPVDDAFVTSLVDKVLIPVLNSF
jgi:hypothetical protein